MEIYVLISFWLFSLAILDSIYRIRKRGRLFLYITISLFFWVMSFVRWETGTDWESYYNFFNNHYTWQEFLDASFEVGFTAINFGVKQISDNYSFLLFSVSCIIFPLKYSTIWRYSPYPFFSLILSLLLSKADIFFVRETIALSITFFSVRYIINREKWKFFICLLFALQFHSSIIVFIFAYYIYSMRLTKYRLTVLVVGVVFFSIASTVVLSTLGNTLGGVFQWKIANYLEYGDEDFGMGISLQEALIRGSINRLFFLSLFIYLYMKNKADVVLSGLIKVYTFNYVLFLMLVPISLPLMRLANSYEQLSILIIGIGLSKFVMKDRFVITFILSIYMFLRFFMGTLSGGYAHCFVPYKTIFF